METFQKNRPIIDICYIIFKRAKAPKNATQKQIDNLPTQYFFYTKDNDWDWTNDFDEATTFDDRTRVKNILAFLDQTEYLDTMGCQLGYERLDCGDIYESN